MLEAGKSRSALEVLYVVRTGLVVGWLVLTGIQEALKPSPPTVCEQLASSSDPRIQAQGIDCLNQNQP